ncbi:MAG: VWA domain-containing protein [Parcubacteria group bacterium]
MKKLIIFLIIIIAGFALSSTANAANQNVLIVFDASGSMLDSFGGTTRIDAAKAAVNDLLSGFDSSINSGLRAYAHISKSDKGQACIVTDLLQSFTTNHQSVINKVNSIQAVGNYTPTAYALQQAANDFVPGEDNTLILLSDGLETCGGNPATAAKALCDAGINVKSFVVGLGVDSATRSQLQGVADLGCGKYFDASDTASLQSSLGAITTEQGIDKSSTDPSIEKTRVRGGNGFTDAVPVTVGEYQLDHHQREGDFDYFKFNMEPDAIYKITLRNTDEHIKYDAKTDTFVPASESSSPSIVMIMHIADRQKIKRITSTGEWSKTEYFVQYADGRMKGRDQLPFYSLSNYLEIDESSLYILVGNDYTTMHKDSSFKIEPVDEYGEPISSTNSPTPTAEIDGKDDTDEKTGLSKEILGLPLYLWLIIGGAVIVIVIVIILLMKRGSGSGTPTSMPPQQPQPPVQPPTIPPQQIQPPQSPPPAPPTVPPQVPPQQPPTQ